MHTMTESGNQPTWDIDALGQLEQGSQNRQKPVGFRSVSRFTTQFLMKKKHYYSGFMNPELECDSHLHILYMYATMNISAPVSFFLFKKRWMLLFAKTKRLCIIIVCMIHKENESLWDKRWRDITMLVAIYLQLVLIYLQTSLSSISVMKGKYGISRP
jgi:hypothetical protein